MAKTTSEIQTLIQNGTSFRYNEYFVKAHFGEIKEIFDVVHGQHNATVRIGDKTMAGAVDNGTTQTISFSDGSVLTI